MRISALAPLLVAALAAAAPAAANPAAAAAASAEGTSPATLVVATKEAPPFALRGPGGEWTGIAIELWQAVARDLGLAYRFEEADLESLIDGLADGRFDASVAALTVTAEREEAVDFTHAFHSSGLAIAVAARGGGWQAAARRIFSPALLGVIGTLVLVLFAIGVAVWLLERRKNPDDFEPGLAGLWSAFWWSAVTMTTVGYGDKAPATVGGRVLALFWMFTSVVVISSFTAAIASSLTVAELGAAVRGPDDLPRAAVASVDGSTSGAYLARRGIGFERVASVGQALEAVAEERADAAVYDAPILRYLVNRRPWAGQLTVLPVTFERQDYAIALPPGSDLRERVNVALLREISSAEWGALLERYLGE